MHLEQSEMTRLKGVLKKGLSGTSRFGLALALMMGFSACEFTGKRELNQPGRSGDLDCQLLSPLQCQAQKMRRKLESHPNS